MSRSSLLVRVARIIQRLPLWIFQPLDNLLRLFVSGQSKRPVVIFLLALPRSGSTLTYQVLCHAFKTQYLSNSWNLLYQLPCLGGLFSRSFSSTHRSDFSSDQGFISGSDGPAEGLRFWKYWLGCGLSDNECLTTETEMSRRRVGYIRSVLSGLTDNKKPFVSAYLGHTLIPDYLHKCFPEAVTIRLRRDPIDNALSILTSMRDNNSHWFSLFTRQCLESEGLNEYERVASQVYWLNRRLDEAACETDMLEIRYEELCKDPVAIAKKIQTYCSLRGIKLEPKFELPPAFSYKHCDLPLNEDAKAIVEALNNLERQYGALK